MSEARFLDASDEVVRAAWAGLLERSEQASPFSTLAYAEALCEATGLSFRLAGVWDEDVLSAGVLLFEKRLGPYHRVVVPPLTPWTSFLLGAPLRESDVTHRRSMLDVLLALLEPTYHALAFHLHPTLHDVRPFQWRGFDTQVLYTYRQTLPERDALLRQASRSVRRSLKRADGTLTVNTRGSSEQAARLVLRSQARQDHPFALTEQRLTRMTERLRAAGLARVFLACDDGGNVRGAQVMLCHAGQACHWVGGSFRGPAKTLLVVEAMEHLRDEGLTSIDMVGANTPSIAEFKRSFGLPLTPYYRVERITRPTLKLLLGLRRLVAS